MMNQLYIREGDIVVVKNVSLQLATFSKFQPQTVDFLDITNPKAVYPCQSESMQLNLILHLESICLLKVALYLYR